MELPVAQRIEGGQILTPSAAGGLTVVAARDATDKMRVLGYRIQIHSATKGYNTYIEGTAGTKISGPVYSDENGLDYVQDNLNVQLQAGEGVQIRSRTDGTIVWSVILENEK